MKAVSAILLIALLIAAGFMLISQPTHRTNGGEAPATSAGFAKAEISSSAELPGCPPPIESVPFPHAPEAESRGLAQSATPLDAASASAERSAPSQEEDLLKRIQRIAPQWTNGLEGMDIQHVQELVHSAENFWQAADMRFRSASSVEARNAALRGSGIQFGTHDSQFPTMESAIASFEPIGPDDYVTSVHSGTIRRVVRLTPEENIRAVGDRELDRIRIGQILVGGLMHHKKQ